jgi:hypothetical protein
MGLGRTSSYQVTSPSGRVHLHAALPHKPTAPGMTPTVRAVQGQTCPAGPAPSSGTTNIFTGGSSGPMRAGDHAARGPRRHLEPIAPNGDGPPHRAIPGSSAVRITRLQSRGHRRPVRPDTWMAPVAWTPDAWTPDVRVTDWTDIRTADRGRGQGDDRRGRRPDILATGDHPLGGQTSPGRSVWGAWPPMTAPW